MGPRCQRREDAEEWGTEEEIKIGMVEATDLNVGARDGDEEGGGGPEEGPGGDDARAEAYAASG